MTENSDRPDPTASLEDQNREFVSQVAWRRGITLGHLREDGSRELREIMRRLDGAHEEIDRLRSALDATPPPATPPASTLTADANADDDALLEELTK